MYKQVVICVMEDTSVKAVRPAAGKDPLAVAEKAVKDATGYFLMVEDQLPQDAPIEAWKFDLSTLEVYTEVNLIPADWEGAIAGIISMAGDVKVQLGLPLLQVLEGLRQKDCVMIGEAVANIPAPFKEDLENILLANRIEYGEAPF